MDFKFERNPASIVFERPEVEDTRSKIEDQEWEIMTGDHWILFEDTRQIKKSLPTKDRRSSRLLAENTKPSFLAPTRKPKRHEVKRNEVTDRGIWICPSS
jgi:hypothetical protein